MKLHLYRNATMKLDFGGKTFLTDPMLSPVGTIRSFAGIAENPTVELPVSPEEVVEGIDAVLLTHTHPDHIDKPACDHIPKMTPFFCRPGDEGFLTDEGFGTIIPVETVCRWEGIEIIRTGGMHGKGEIQKMMGEVSGFVLKAPKEPVVYWAGDTIWCDAVEQTISEYKPDIIITHSGGATLPGHDPIIMDIDDTLAVLNASKEGVVTAIHMEALDHCTVTRKALRQKAEEEKIPASRLLIPKDGDSLELY